MNRAVVITCPCVAAMGAYVREFGNNFARFIAVWTMGLAYLCATFYNQLTHFPDSPATSGIWIAVILAIFFGTYRVFKQVGKKQNGALEAQVA